MGKLCGTMMDASKAVWRYFFPAKKEIPDCVWAMLRAIYPKVDWGRVTFYDGIPHFYSWGSEDAITLPDSKSFSAVNVYLRLGTGAWCDCTNDLDLYVHEGAHVLQIQEYLSGYGLGMADPFIMQYLTCSIDCWCYDNNPYEVAARDVEKTFEGCCNSTTIPCDCSTSPPTTNITGIQSLEVNCAGLVRQSSGFDFWKQQAECTPGLEYIKRAAEWLLEKLKGCGTIIKKDGLEGPDAPGPLPMRDPEPNPKQGNFLGILCRLGILIPVLLYIVYGLYYVLWVAISLAIGIVAELATLLAELIGLLASGVMWIVTGILCALEWIWEKLKQFWNWIKEQLAKVCNWATSLEAECAEWEESREKKCTETKDNGYNKCTREEDQGYSKCAEEEDRGYKDCCDWAPCSWFCDAWVWVSNVVCVAWTWVSNIVCVAWTWVSNVVCVAWTWIVSKSCKAFTWVVKGVTCWAA